MLARGRSNAYRALRTSACVAVGLACATAACGTPGFVAPLAHAPEMPGEQTRCRLAANQEDPLVTEWPAPEKANLEARLSEGSVVVAYSGCTLRMLPRCRVGGSYRWRRTTISTDTLEIHNADELYAKLPLGAVSLEGELERTGRLAVQTSVSGQFQLTGFDPASIPRGPECEGATHVVGALSVGAFKLRSGGTAKVGGQATVVRIGSAHGSSDSEETIMRAAGAPDRCEQATEAAPHPDCASPLQMFLQALPASVVDRGPIGTVKVKFLPVQAAQEWDVVVGDRTLCKTPCERWVDPAMPYTLKYDPGLFQKNEYIEVPDLRAQPGSDRLLVRAEPRNLGEFVGGTLLCAFGGLGVVTGTALTAAGCGSGDAAMCTAGLVTLPIGLLALAPGIWMIVDSKGVVHVTPMQAHAASIGARFLADGGRWPQDVAAAGADETSLSTSR